MDRSEAVHEAVAVLARQRRYDEAAEVLRREIAASTESGASFEVAFFHSLLGSMLRILHRDEEALAAYRAAEAAAPDEPNYKISVAAELLKQNRPEEALTKAQQAEQQLRVAPAWHQGVYGLLGLCYLELGRERDAVRTFRELVNADLVEGMLGQERIFRAHDLRFAAALAKRKLIVHELRVYAEMVRSKAVAQGAHEAVEFVREILKDD